MTTLTGFTKKTTIAEVTLEWVLIDPLSPPPFRTMLFLTDARQPTLQLGFLKSITADGILFTEGCVGRFTHYAVVTKEVIPIEQLRKERFYAKELHF